MIVYRPKHKKSLSERFDDSFVHDELTSTDFFLGFSAADTLDLNKAIEDDSAYKSMEYYEDEIFMFKSGALLIVISIIIAIII